MKREDVRFAANSVRRWPWNPHKPPLWERALRSRETGHGVERGGGVSNELLFRQQRTEDRGFTRGGAWKANVYTMNGYGGGWCPKQQISPGAPAQLDSEEIAEIKIAVATARAIGVRQ